MNGKVIISDSVQLCTMALTHQQFRYSAHHGGETGYHSQLKQKSKVSKQKCKHPGKDLQTVVGPAGEHVHVGIDVNLLDALETDGRDLAQTEPAPSSVFGGQRIEQLGHNGCAGPNLEEGIMG